MSVFRDESGRRARAVWLASVLGAVAALVSAGVFLVSVFPAPWTRKAVAPEPAPAGKVVSRERAYRKEEQRLRSLIERAARAERRRKPADAHEPVLAGFAVNWDSESLHSLQAHADQLTHVMPEWIRVAPDGGFLVEEDARMLQSAQRLEVTPVVQNYGDAGFDRALATRLLATDASRKDAARRLRALCEERGFAGLNLDFENLTARDWQSFAALVEAVWAELHARGFVLSVDVPAETSNVPVERLAAATDFLVVMAYDDHEATDNPGPIASPATVATAMAAYLRRAPADHLVAALGAYGYDWPLDEDGDTARPAAELSFAQALVLARENEVGIEWDEDAKGPFFEYDDDSSHEKHLTRFLDAPAMLAQLEAIEPLHLRGVALWRLGAEDPRIFDLFDKSPAPRRFDEAQARTLLDGVITARDPDDVQIVGDGELFAVKSWPQNGKRTVQWDRDGHLASEAYVQYPSGFILERRGGRPKGKVLLTFDDGPDPQWTPKLLQLLRDRHAEAAFFLIGENAQAWPELVRRELAEGHVIGNHTYTHPELSQVGPLRMDVELNVDERLLEWISGRQIKLFRPPYHSDEGLDETPKAQVLARAAAAGYFTLGHDDDPEDFALRDPQEIARRVLAKAHDGAVILLHDGGGDRAATLAALPIILDGLAARGLVPGTVEEFTGLSRDQLMPQAPALGILAGADSVVFSVLGTVGRFLGPAFGFALALLGLRAVILAVCAPIQARRARRRGTLPPAGVTVSVVVPAYNEETVIVRTVESLLAQEPKVLEVVCVDDGSKDRTLDVLRAAYETNPRVRIFGKVNGGKASALNLGFAEARGEVVVALDSDTLFGKDTVARLVAPFADPRVGAVAGNAKVGNRVNHLTRWQALEYVTAQNLERRAWDLAKAVPVVPGAVGAWRRKLVLEEGGFHEDTLAEDTDLTLRLIARGMHVVYAEQAVAWTEAPETAHSLLKQRFRWTYGVLQACWKHKARLFRRGGGVLGWLILPAFAVYQFVVPFVAPVVDLLLVISLVRGQALATAGYYVLFFALDLLLSAVAILLEGEDLKLLLGLFVQRIVYRQLLWVALVRSLWNALSGFAVGWGKLQRTGSVQAPS